MPKSVIHIEEARHHNLASITLDIPRDELVVICGPSGSGKSTLAFDIVYAEGQRRYMESLSAYARQFLPQMDKPDVGRIDGLSPSISLEQQSVSHNPRSTVGTVTEIYDFLRVLFARLGVFYCPSCGKAISTLSIDEILENILGRKEGSRFLILAPLVEHQKGGHQERLKKLKAEGFVRVRIDGEVANLEEIPALDKNKKHSLDLVVDRLILKEGIRSRLADSVELALRYGAGRLIVHEQSPDGTGRDIFFSTERSCPTCHISMPKPSPQLFSFNGPQGACPRCVGLGTVEYFEPRLIAPNRGLSLLRGALLPWSGKKVFERYQEALAKLGSRFGFSLETPLDAFSDEALAALFYGETDDGKPAHDSLGLRRNWMGGNIALGAAGDYQSAHFLEAQEAQKTIEVRADRWPGVVPLLEKGMQYGDAWREELGRFRNATQCPDCHGRRLRAEALSLRIDDLNIADFCSLSIGRARDWLMSRSFSGRQQKIFEPLQKELCSRLSFLIDVGLDYITLARSMVTMSGGEAQRIRLASQLGSGLVGVIYVLDEPSIGLHPSDNARLLSTLRSLQSRGNSVLVVEHDATTICAADTVIEMGPGSGEHGGKVIFQGDVDALLHSTSLTARHLRGEEGLPIPDLRRSPEGWLVLHKVTTNNLCGSDFRFPLHTLTCVTGVSGSGKSSLVMETLYKHVALSLGLKVEEPGTIDGLSYEDGESFERVSAIDQSPIGRTPRSNPATYTKVFDEIRSIFALTQDARKRGYNSGRFSFNVAGGRCEACRGEGQIRVEMHFLPDVFVTCDVCGGMRYNHETLEVRYKGLNIAEVLNLTVQQARDFFENYPALARRLAVLDDVGLGYLRLGQPATTLSGGEAQRIKISRELGKPQLARTLYILDEPTTGLHMHEVSRLIQVLHALVDKGATVVVIEHNTDMILAADYVMDLGPGGGENGGRIVSCGTPEYLVADPGSVTGSFLMQERVARMKRGRRFSSALQDRPGY